MVLRRTWQINREMLVLHEQFKMMQHWEHHSRYRIKWGHRNIPSVPKPIAQYKWVSATMAFIGGWSRSRSSSKCTSIFVFTAFRKPGKSFPRPTSEGMQLGTVANRIWAGGFGSELMNPSHSSVTMKLMRISAVFEARSLHKFIIALMWLRLGYGIATRWKTVGSGCSVFARSILMETDEIEER